MKKYFVGFLLLGALNSVHAESIMRNYYTVVSNEFNKDVKVGTCLLSGKVVDMNGNPIQSGTIANLDRSRSCITDAKGNYSMVLSSKDTAIFFYHENYGEIVIWKFEFKSQHQVVINFFSDEISDLPIMVEKPVIYLYSDTETDVEIVLNHDALSFTYPVYNKGWNVQTTSAGGLLDKSTGKEYPYLFWEACLTESRRQGKSNSLNYKSENNLVQGFLIKSDSTVSFLEHSLSKLGLNEKEQTDFITYWAPRMIQKEFAFVQFLVDEEYETSIAGLTVNPKPDSQRRIYMLFTPLEKPFVFLEYETQILPSFSRKGLTLIEWGGSELGNPQLVP